MENSSQSGESSGILPSLALNSFSLQLPSASTTFHQVTSPVPRISIPSKRSGKVVRPSTASAVEERTSLLPSAPNGTILEVTTPDSSPRREPAMQNSMTLGARVDNKKVVSVKNPSEENSHPTLGAYSL